MSIAGDVNGDGADDLLVGAPSATWGVGRADLYGFDPLGALRTFQADEGAGSYGAALD